MILKDPISLTFKKADFDKLTDAQKNKTGEIKQFGPKEGIINKEGGWKVRTRIKKVKPDLTGLADAKFGVYTDFECTNEVASMTSGADGMLDIAVVGVEDDKEQITLYVKEKEAPPGYTPSNDVFDYTYEKKNYDGKDGELYVFGPKEGVVNDVGWRVRVHAKKVNQTGAPLAGAVFKVYDKDGKVYENLVSTADGSTNIVSISAPMDKTSITISCKEIEAPENCELIEDEFSVTFEKSKYDELAKGDITFEGELKQLGPETGIVNENTTITVTPTPTLTPPPTSAGIHVQKTSTAASDIMDLHSYSLAGGEFVVSNGIGTLVTTESGISNTLPLPDNHIDRWVPEVTDSEGHHLSGGYWVEDSVTTTYTVTEQVAPPGHKKINGSKSFTTVMSQDKDKPFEVSFEDEPYFCENELKVEKLGGRGEKVEGVVYKVEFFDSPTMDRSKLKRTWYLETDADGIIKLDDNYVTHRLGYKSDPFYMHKGKVVVPIDCYIQFTEVAAPAEYMINEKPFGMETGKDGKADLSKRVYNDTVPCEIKLKKIDEETEEPMIGVEFELKFVKALIQETPDRSPNFKRLLEEGETIVRHTNDDGEVVFSGLDLGRYQITEIKTNPGKNLLKEPIIVDLPMVMTESEANEYGNVDFSTAKEDVSYSNNWYFYSCTFEITNNVKFVMPMSGGLGTWKYGFFGFGTVAIISTGLIFNEMLKKKRKRHKQKNSFKI